MSDNVSESLGAGLLGYPSERAIKWLLIFEHLRMQLVNKNATGE